MRTTPQKRTAGTARSVSFDPFGEPLDMGRTEACRGETPRDGVAYRATAAVFWTLALLLVAGRVYFSETPVAQTFASLMQTAQAGISVLR